MNLSFVKLFSKRPASASRVPHAVSARRSLGVAALALWAFAALPAHAQDPSPESDDTSVTLSDPLGPPSAEEQKALPNVQLTSQIVFQVLAAEVALQRNQPAPAYQTYLALARDTHDPRMAQRATEIALAAQSPSDALAAAQLWQQYAPNSERAAQLDASLLVLSGKPDDAAPLLARELEQVPAQNRGSAILALQLLISRGPNRIGGLHVLQDLLKNDMNRPEAQLAIARQQLVSNDAPGARKSLEQALALKPDYLPAALMLSQMGPEERKEGIASLEKYVQQNPKSHDARLALAQMYLASDRLDDAQKQFEIMHKANANDLTPLMALALIKSSRRISTRRRPISRSTRSKPRRRLARMRGKRISILRSCRSNRRTKRPQPTGSTRFRRRASSTCPRRSRARSCSRSKASLTTHAANWPICGQPIRATSVGRTNRRGHPVRREALPEAETRLQQATAAFPDDPDLSYDYAMAAEKNGHFDVMEAQLRKLIQTQPDNPQAYNALGYSLADRNQRLAEADKLVEKASSLAPNDAFIMDSVGWVKYRHGQYVGRDQSAAQGLRHSAER